MELLHDLGIQLLGTHLRGVGAYIPPKTRMCVFLAAFFTVTQSASTQMSTTHESSEWIHNRGSHAFGGISRDNKNQVPDVAHAGGLQNTAEQEKPVPQDPSLGDRQQVVDGQGLGRGDQQSLGMSNASMAARVCKHVENH